MSSRNSGFVLSDALISIVITGMIAMIAFSSMNALVHTRNIIQMESEVSNENYESSLSGLTACVLCTPSPQSTDTSSSSF